MLTVMPQDSICRLHYLLKKFTTISQLKQIHTHLIITRPFFFFPSILYNILIRAYSKSSNPHQSFLLFRHIILCKPTPNTLPLPDNYTFTFVVSSCSRHPTPELGEIVHAQSIRTGFGSDTNVGNSLINFYSVFGEICPAQKVFDEMRLRDVVTWTSLIKGYTKIGELARARQLFDRMPHRNMVSWAVMIAGYANGEFCNEALRLFNVMLSEIRETPNEAVIVSVLSACAHLGALGQGEWVHAYVNKNKLTQSSNIFTALINMYSRCGSIESAKQVFGRSSIRNLMTWTSMISGLALYGLGEDALALFYRMLDSGVRPDGVTVLGVLNACSHSGLVDEGLAIFCDMGRLWKIFPTIGHYGCLIDLLGRAGHLEKAVAIVIKMPVEPDIVIWRALLSACRCHGNIALSERIMNHVATRDLDNRGGGHVLLSNLYASVGKWDKVVSVRKRMEEGSKGMSPGCSWIEVDGVVHEFLAVDRLHPRIEEIRSKLGEVLQEVRLKGGYVVDTKNVLFDLSEEDKEQAVHLHSEKLAVAFGLMSVETGSCIRIVKNLRICEDCHSAMKAISKVFGREIVVRDRSRFHTFREGSCSCKDYW